MARVRALMEYIEANKRIYCAQRARVLFSGGWGAAAAKLKAPPEEYREGILMFKYAQALSVNGIDLSSYAESSIEIESDSTLENVLHAKENGYFLDDSFTTASPLGIVSHASHQKRIEYFIHKVFGLPDDAILPIIARGNDNPGNMISEKALLLFTRLAFIGASSHSALRHRQHLALMARNALRM